MSPIKVKAGPEAPPEQVSDPSPPLGTLQLYPFMQNANESLFGDERQSVNRSIINKIRDQQIPLEDVKKIVQHGPDEVVVWLSDEVLRFRASGDSVDVGSYPKDVWEDSLQYAPAPQMEIDFSNSETGKEGMQISYSPDPGIKGGYTDSEREYAIRKNFRKVAGGSFKQIVRSEGNNLSLFKPNFVDDVWDKIMVGPYINAGIVEQKKRIAEVESLSHVKESKSLAARLSDLNNSGRSGPEVETEKERLRALIESHVQAAVDIDVSATKEQAQAALDIDNHMTTIAAMMQLGAMVVAKMSASAAIERSIAEAAATQAANETPGILEYARQMNVVRRSFDNPAGRSFIVTGNREAEAIVRRVAQNVVDAIPSKTATKLGWRSKEDMAVRLLREKSAWTFFKNWRGYPDEMSISKNFGAETITQVADNLDVLEPSLGRQAANTDSWYHGTLTHGTNTSALPGVVRKGGFVPGGQLMEDPAAMPPFSGEEGYIYGNIKLPGGFEHTNARSISTVINGTRSLGSQSADIEYAMDAKGWSPKGGEGRIATLEKKLTEPKIEMTVGDRQSINEGYRRGIELEKRRISAYERLPVEEQELISNPFPMVMRINDYDPALVGKVITNVSGEVPYGGPCLFGKEVDAIFVPAEKVDFTIDYLARHGVENVKVVPLELLEDYRALSRSGIFPPPHY